MRFLLPILLCANILTAAETDSLRWKGFNIGVNTGALVNRSTTTVTGDGGFLLPPYLDNNNERSTLWNVNNNGLTIGAQLGYTYQITYFICGLETDINFSSLNYTEQTFRIVNDTFPSTFQEVVDHKIGWFGTLRPRLGVGFDKLAAYITGGLLYGQVKSKTQISYRLDPYIGRYNKTKLGWTAGGGIDGSLSETLSLRFEYLYLSFKNVQYFDPNTSNTYPDKFFLTTVKSHVHCIRVGFNRSF
jgi:outer membrane immunogenic protein